jgi:ubiquitin carboxyl-terminal hydrolase MINDY-3/4
LGSDRIDPARVQRRELAVMGDREEDEELQMALRMSLQGSPLAQPEPKRSKPPPSSTAESPEAEARRKQREVMAAAAEMRLRATASPVAARSSQPKPLEAEPAPIPVVTKEEEKAEPKPAEVPMDEAMGEAREVEVGGEEGEEIPLDVAEKLWAMVFGGGVSKAVLAQWSNQGIR